MTVINLTTAAGKTKPAQSPRVDFVASMKRLTGQEKAAPVGAMAANMQKLLDKRGTDR